MTNVFQPRDGKHPIPESVIRFLNAQPVAQVRLSGTGLWYALELDVVAGSGSAADRSSLQGRLIDLLQSEGFKTLKPFSDDTPGIVRLENRTPGEALSCFVMIKPSKIQPETALYVSLTVDVARAR